MAATVGCVEPPPEPKPVSIVVVESDMRPFREHMKIVTHGASNESTASDDSVSVVSNDSNNDAVTDSVEPEPEPTPEPTPEPQQVSSGIPWDELARCESGYGSGPTWDIDTGNGFYGGLQFEKESWDWAGGQQYAEYPHHATREQQIAVAEQLLAIHPAGIGAWPSCADKLGLR